MTLKQETAQDHDYFLKMIQEQKEGEMASKRIEEAKRNAFRKHADEVLEQQKEMADRKRKERQLKLEEGRNERKRLADDILKLESIRANKIKEMEEQGYSDKYMLDLKTQQLASTKVTR